MNYGAEVFTTMTGNSCSYLPILPYPPVWILLWDSYLGTLGMLGTFIRVVESKLLHGR